MDVGGGWGGGREIGGRNKGAHKTFQPPHPDGWIHHKHLDNPKEVRMAGAGSDDTNTQHINHLHSLGSSPTPSRPAATSGDWNHIQECRGGGLATACGTTNKMGPAGHLYRCVGIVEWSEGHSAWSGLQVTGPGTEAVGWGV